MKEFWGYKFCIWGTGKYAKVLYKEIEHYVEVVHKWLHIDLLDCLSYFIDSNVEKQGKQFEGKEIISPMDYFAKPADICIVATLSRKEIYDTLEAQGKKHQRDYFSSEEFIEYLKKQILGKREFIFHEMKLGYLDEYKLLGERLLGVKQAIIKGKDYYREIEKYIIFSVIVDSWKKAEQRAEAFQRIQEYFEESFIIGAFAWYYGNDITDISNSLKVSNNKEIVKKPTIGIVVYNFFGGGIEKVISLLIPIFIQHGHRVVLITDSFMPDKEYKLPNETIRYVMNYKMDDMCEKRVDELRKCVNDFDIDVMCFHSGYTYISTFYDMWGIKLLKIPVIIELHSFFYPIIHEKKEVSRYYSDMYRMADKVIVLSETDKVFWNSLGCDCVYIQNPIEDVIEEHYKKLETDEKEYYTVVWVGRLVQLPKRVLDVVPIMRKVIAEIPNVKLKLVGMATNKGVYNELIQAISDNDLENVVEICGYQTDISNIYKEADVVLMTSESESFCNVIIESKLHGIPLVMYELPWLELLKDKKGFIAVEQKNTSAIANALIKLLQDEEMQKQMSAAAYESAKQFVEYDVYTEWIKMFNSLNDRKEAKGMQLEVSIIENKLLELIYEK